VIHRINTVTVTNTTAHGYTSSGVPSRVESMYPAQVNVVYPTLIEREATRCTLLAQAVKAVPCPAATNARVSASTLRVTTVSTARELL
jgi:hypothetical protein